MAVILCYSLAIIMAFYGISLSNGYMPGSLYTIMALSTIAEFVGFNICFICLVVGKKWPYVIGLVGGGLSCMMSVVAFSYYKGM